MRIEVFKTYFAEIIKCAEKRETFKKVFLQKERQTRLCKTRAWKDTFKSSVQVSGGVCSQETEAYKNNGSRRNLFLSDTGF